MDQLMHTSLLEVNHWLLARLMLWHWLIIIPAIVLVNSLWQLVKWERDKRRQAGEHRAWQRLQECLISGRHAAKGKCQRCGLDGPGGAP